MNEQYNFFPLLKYALTKVCKIYILSIVERPAQNPLWTSKSTPYTSDQYVSLLFRIEPTAAKHD